MTFIAPIVEGHGEQQAVRRLLARIAKQAAPNVLLRINEPIRVKSGSFINDNGYFQRYVALAAAKARQHPLGAVLVILDCDDECPARLGPSLLARARECAAGVEVVVALAYREYETWFMAAAHSLRGVCGLAPSATAPQSPENTRDAKGWLGKQMPNRYDPIAHQLPFTEAFDLQAARTVPSFDRLWRKLAALLQSSEFTGEQQQY